jgi:hypothetical protein
MSRHDLVFGVSVAESYPETTVSGSETGTTLDGKGKIAVKHVIHAHAVTTDILVKLQDSPDDSTFTDVVASEVTGADSTSVNYVTIAATGGDNTAAQLGYLGLQRYTRIAVISGAGSMGAVSHATDALGS